MTTLFGEIEIDEEFLRFLAENLILDSLSLITKFNNRKSILERNN